MWETDNVAQQNAQKQGFSLGRIAKPLRGGGGGQYETPNYQVGGQVGKLQSEEGTKRRTFDSYVEDHLVRWMRDGIADIAESWFFN